MPLSAFWIAANLFRVRFLAFVDSSTSCKAAGSDFGPPLVFDFPSTYHIWWAFPYPPPGEALDGRSETPHETLLLCRRILRPTLIRGPTLVSHPYQCFKLLVFLACSGNPFHARMLLGKKEYLYAFVLA